MVLGIAGVVGGCGVIRSAVIGIKENDYFPAARAVGTPTVQILIRHVLPDIMAPLIIIFSIKIGDHHFGFPHSSPFASDCETIPDGKHTETNALIPVKEVIELPQGIRVGILDFGAGNTASP